MKKVAVYGGSFDPPQVCHLLVATYALTRGDYDEIRVVPVFAHPFEKTLAPFEHRVRMLRESLAYFGPKIVVDPIESTLPTPNYTIDTVRAMLDRDGDIQITLLCGTDVYADRHRWKDWEELSQLVTFQVFGRDGVLSETPSSTLPSLPDVSSSQIRERLMRGQSVGHLVPREALEIIQAEGLYVE